MAMTAHSAGTAPCPAKAITGYVVAAALTAAATLVAVLIERLTPIPNLSLVFVLPVVIAAVSYGWGPSALAAAAGTLCYNFFLIPPLYTLRIEDPANVWAVGLLLIVATIVSVVAARSRRQAIEAREHADNASALEALANAIAAAPDQAAIAKAAAEALGRLFKAPAVVLTVQDEGLTLAGRTAGAKLSAPDREAADWVLNSGLASRAQTYPIEDADFDFWPTAKPAGVMGVAFGAKGESRPAQAERLVEIVNGYLAVAYDRQDRHSQPSTSRF